MKATLTIICASLISLATQARVVNATDMTAAQWAAFAKGQATDIVIEFQTGGQLPLTFTAQGDLLESTQTAPSFVTIKKDFWVRINGTSTAQPTVQISFDNSTFQDINSVIGGSLTVGTGADHSGGMANALNIDFKAFLK
jgi:hypothetical protein